MLTAVKTSIIVLLAALFGLLAYGVAASRPDRTVENDLAGGRLSDPPPFDLEVLSGAPGQLGPRLEPRVRPALEDGRLSLDELRGTPVVLNVWASWCKPCLEEASVLEQGWRDARGTGVLVLGLNVLDNRPDARAFIRRVGMSYPTVREPTNANARRFGAVGVPETYFITPRGKIAARVIGAISPQQLASGIRAAVTERPLVVQRGGASRTVP